VSAPMIHPSRAPGGGPGLPAGGPARHTAGDAIGPGVRRKAPHGLRAQPHDPLSHRRERRPHPRRQRRLPAHERLHPGGDPRPHPGRARPLGGSGPARRRDPGAQGGPSGAQHRVPLPGQERRRARHGALGRHRAVRRGGVRPERVDRHHRPHAGRGGAARERAALHGRLPRQPAADVDHEPARPPPPGSERGRDPARRVSG